MVSNAVDGEDRARESVTLPKASSQTILVTLVSLGVTAAVVAAAVIIFYRKKSQFRRDPAAIELTTDRTSE